MNWLRRFHIRWLCLLLPLVFFSANGCSTTQPDAAANHDLEKYRKVYLVRPSGDDRNLTAGILARLQRAGFDASAIDNDEAKKLANARDVTEPTLVCRCTAVSTYDYNRAWYCFESVQIHFYDLEKKELVFRADYFHPNSFLPENTELNFLFIKIRDNFFPGQPNPFRENLRGPYGPSNHKFQIDD